MSILYYFAFTALRHAANTCETLMGCLRPLYVKLVQGAVTMERRFSLTVAQNP